MKAFVVALILWGCAVSFGLGIMTERMAHSARREAVMKEYREMTQKYRQILMDLEKERRP